MSPDIAQGGRLTAGDMQRIALDEYFAVVSADTLPATLGFFHPDATFSLYPSGRVFRGHDAIMAMYGQVFARHRTIERTVTDISIDEDRQVMAASFIGRSRSLDDAGDVIMHNVNFWYFDGPRFRAVKVFTSDAKL